MLSVLHHVTNKHEWSSGVNVHQCGHPPPLCSADKNEIKWLKPNSPAYAALKTVVTNTALIKALPNLTKFCHTGELEVFHSMLLPKRQHFHHDGELYTIKWY